jgi:predicted RNA-binding protein
LEKAQIRRIAHETTETQIMMRDTMGMVREYEGRLRAIEERLQMSRIGY